MNFSSPLRIITVGHVDHGKSTLLGRLLYDTDSLSQEQIAAVEAASKAEGVPLEYAFLLDAFLEEQAQNITIETTQIPFKTALRSYLLIDAPGHREFLKNMVTGASSATAAILLIDINEGIQEQTRRHLQLLTLLGIQQVVVAINKMDLVDYSSAAFEKTVQATKKLFYEFDLASPTIIPIAARTSENVASRSIAMPWHKGPTLVEALDQLKAPPSLDEGPLRFVVQDIYRFDTRRLIVGRIESGALHVGEEIIFLPDGKKSRVRFIEEWHTALPPTKAMAGESVAITLEEPLFVERGYIATHVHTPPATGRALTARLFWLDAEPLGLHQPITFKLGTQSVEASVIKIRDIQDATTLQSSSTAHSKIAQNEIATVTFHLKKPIAYDCYDHVAATGRFAIATPTGLGGGGIILKTEATNSVAMPVTSTDLTWTVSRIDCEARKKKFGHCGAVLWFTGLSGSGKSTLATGLEALLHKRGMATFLLDGDNLRHGLCADLGFSAEDRSENIRRTGETAKLFAEAGLIVLCALISPFQGDRERVRATCARDGILFLEIFVDTSLATCEKRDPRGLYAKARSGEITNFTGISSLYEVPQAPEMRLSTDHRSVEETLQELHEFISSFFSQT
jgi:bifunctional enzyme CysN/CysC